MKLIKNITLGFAALAAVVVTSCKDDFMDTAPTGAVSDAIIKASVQSCYLALNGIQKEMVSQESGYQALGGLPGFMFSRDWQADDITCHDTGENWHTRFATWQNITKQDNGYNYQYYRVNYQWILNANKILEALAEINKESLSASDQDLYDQVKGEALCFRAFAHYELVQMYAKRYVPGQSNSQDGVIYRKSSAVEELGRESVEDVYKDVITDFTEAANLLKGKKVNDVNHFSEKVAKGFLARVSLTMGKYSDAFTYADAAIELAKKDGQKLMDESNIYCGFADICSDTKEVMWGAMTPDDKTVYFYSFMAYMSWNFNATAVRTYVNCINKDLYETMSETDLRLKWWDPTGTLAGPLSTFVSQPYQNRKYTARSSSNAVCHVAFMRLAEMYLIKAEAAARANMPAANEYFKDFQISRDPSFAGTSNTGEALITEIMNSRRVELWGEGQRMFDLKRLDGKVVRDDLCDVTKCGFKERNASEWVYEIPKHETDYNPSCTKNY